MIPRHKKILELLTEKEDISVNELSELLDVTEVTIRSDLTKLSEEKKVIRSHGRVSLLGERIKAENSFEVRKKQNYIQKIKIGEAASLLINSNETVIIDSSSTALTLASSLKARNDLSEVTVIPTGIWSAIELMGISEINVLLPGGYLRTISGSITGLPTTDFLSGLNIKKAFLGAWGISLEKGFMDSHLLEIELKKYIIKSAKEVIILADGSKFNQLGLAAYAEIENVSTLITDSLAPKKVIEKIKSKGVNVICVN
jgi:DeoR/GlpR family transcriptional regulator of sugar metabolism